MKVGECTSSDPREKLKCLENSIKVCKHPKSSQKTKADLDIGAVQKRVNLVDLEKMLQNPLLAKSALIQPRTYLPKFGYATLVSPT